ncbi:hypothetical protein SBOR_6268 [Sclerotinia borealis F-4128]|uniref:Uncharacterized protein n=1 Tax=Sclerotinia borealis (strain F-4128) TaxID=1432307 RepID=W9CBW5_SCLBF|nr:hypothetical protein SBOR_6268 [Sclerotinia borealis F-4128]
MLSSTLTSVSQTRTSPLILYGSISASTNMLRSAGSVWNRSRHNQQTRGFRLGVCWSSYLDPGFDKDIKRRHRILKFKYLEALDRKFAWHHKPSSFMKHFGKSFGCSAWRTHDARPGGRWVNMDRMIKTHDDAEPIPRDTKQDERVPNYKRAMQSFMRSKTIYFSPAHSKHTFKADVENTEGGEPIRLSQAGEAFWRNLSSKNESDRQPNEGYEIDPITNRKVYKKEKAVKIPVRTFKGYRHRFRDLVLPDSSATQDDIENYNKPFMYNEPDGKLPEKPDSTKQGLSDYDSVIEGYEPFLFREPDGKLPEQPDSVQESLKECDGQGYKPFFYNEPDGQLPHEPDPVQKGLRDYDNCTSYNAFRYREPDGKLPEKPDPVQESLRDYDATTTYGFFRHNEPDGKLPEKPDAVQESLQEYDITTSYGSFRYNEPDGKLPEKPDTVREGLKDFDANTSYGSFRYNEPDGKLPENPDAVRESLKDFDANTSYGSFRYNEPDGKLPEKPDTVQEGLKEYDQTQARIAQGSGADSRAQDKKAPEKDTVNQALRDYDSRAPYSPSKTPEASQSQSMLRRYPDADTREDLDLLRASDIRAASGIIKHAKKETVEEKSTKREQLEKAFEEAHQNVVEYAREIATEQRSRWKTEPKVRESPSSSVFKPGEGVGAPDKRDPKAVQVEKQKVTGNFVRDFPEEFQKSWTQQTNGTGALIPKVSQDAWGYDKSPKGLELSYSAEVKQTIQKAEQEYIDGTASKEAFSRNPNTPRLQTSLDRTTTKPTSPHTDVTKGSSEVDPYSKVPQGLETSYREECASQGEGDLSVYVSSYGKARKQSGKDKDLVREIRSIYEDDYGKINSNHRQSPANDVKARNIPGESFVTGSEPTTYKVLAYDSTMQSINIAETTSIVTDNASALTPAEVLLRLSNPAKFFPHFHSLQAEGYEIVSGGGDVLVFRKVRPARRLSSQADLKNNTTNPIDGMQVATGRFASPTGFVNHDLPESAEPPFKSNIDVRREEPVFSGKSSWKDNSKSKRKKPGKTKRVLLGGAIVGGICYAVGVVTEFFRTGGVDGQGPQGF